MCRFFEPSDSKAWAKYYRSAHKHCIRDLPFTMATNDLTGPLKITISPLRQIILEIRHCSSDRHRRVNVATCHADSLPSTLVRYSYRYWPTICTGGNLSSSKQHHANGAMPRDLNNGGNRAERRKAPSVKASERPISLCSAKLSTAFLR